MCGCLHQSIRIQMKGRGADPSVLSRILSLWSPGPPSALYSRKDIWMKGTTSGNRGLFSALCHQVLSGFRSRETNQKGGYFAFLPRRCSQLSVVTRATAQGALWMDDKDHGWAYVCLGEETSWETRDILWGCPKNNIPTWVAKIESGL